MQEIRLRPLTPLEDRLRREKMAEIEAMMDQDNSTLDDPPSKTVIDAANRTAVLFEAIGFVPTTVGVLMRNVDDILDADRSAEDQQLIEADWAQAAKAMRSGPAPV